MYDYKNDKDFYVVKSKQRRGKWIPTATAIANIQT